MFIDYSSDKNFSYLLGRKRMLQDDKMCKLAQIIGPPPLLNHTFQPWVIPR